MLFPETVSVAGRPVNNFGAIFCDRESERLRRVAGAAADLLRLNLPPDAACMLASPAISQQAYILWDLIHDRAHSHGDLPFDPFMIRQRAPYWMYSLEELRCDLTAFAPGAWSSRPRASSFARYVQYAILLDRLLRFPITGSRVRNYDGLGGQLLFAYLHRHGYLHWTDNQLTIEWDRVAEGVAALRARGRGAVPRRASTGPSSSTGRRRTTWSRPACRRRRARSGPRRCATSPTSRIRGPTSTSCCDDEFPLSIFYSSLKAKLAA